MNRPRYNLRDYGGCAVAGGGSLKQGLLLRSGQLDEVLPEDHGLLTRLRVEVVVDLRSSSEIDDPLSVAYAGFSGPIHIADCEDGVIPHAIDGIVGLASASEVPARMTALYRQLPASSRFRQSMAHYLGALDQARGATLVHCFAGKDRTGLAVALVQLALGVHADDVMAEYLMTNAAGEQRILAGLAVLRRQHGHQAREDVLREVMLVKPEYLEAALREVVAHGSNPVAWLGQAAGLEAAQLDRIRLRHIG